MSDDKDALAEAVINPPPPKPAKARRKSTPRKPSQLRGRKTLIAAAVAALLALADLFLTVRLGIKLF